MIGVYSEDQTGHKNTPCNMLEFPEVEVAGIHSYHSALREGRGVNISRDFPKRASVAA